MSVHLLLLAGGKGSRFWPLSRAGRPKQLLPLLSDKSLLRETYDRVRPLARPDRIWLLGSAALKRASLAEVPELSAARFIGEPVGRNTAATVALGAALALAEDPQAVLAVFPSDHTIADLPAFRRAARLALKTAKEKDALVTLGVPPTRAETGYGYIRLSAKARTGSLQQAEAFIEKPGPRKAERFRKDGRHLWNSGMFFFRASVLKEVFLRTAPDIWEPAESLAASYPGASFQRRLRNEFPSIPAKSFDVAVMEKAAELKVIPVKMAWNDVGNWEALGDLLEDRGGNRAKGRLVSLDSKNNIVMDPDGLTALVGVENLVVVRVGERLLVCHRDRAQSVRDLVELLSEEDL